MPVHVQGLPRLRIQDLHTVEVWHMAIEAMEKQPMIVEESPDSKMMIGCEPSLGDASKHHALISHESNPMPTIPSVMIGPLVLKVTPFV